MTDPAGHEPSPSAQQRLFDSALALFAQKGYNGTSIREIIERAGVTRPVLYYYFTNKEDLFRQVVEKQFADASADLDRLLAGEIGCRKRLSLLARYVFDLVEQRPEAVSLILQVFFGPPGVTPEIDRDRLWAARFLRIAGIIEDGIAAGELTGTEPETLAMAFTGMIDMYIMCKAHDREIHLQPALADGLVDLFFAGAASEQGTAHLPAFHSGMLMD